MSNQRQTIIKKLEARINAIRLMRKHKFTTVSHPGNVEEYNTAQNVLEYIKRGGTYTLKDKGFVSCIHGKVACIVPNA